MEPPLRAGDPVSADRLAALRRNVRTLRVQSPAAGGKQLSASVPT